MTERRLGYERYERLAKLLRSVENKRPSFSDCISNLIKERLGSSTNPVMVSALTDLCEASYSLGQQKPQRDTAGLDSSERILLEKWLSPRLEILAIELSKQNTKMKESESAEQPPVSAPVITTQPQPKEVAPAPPQVVIAYTPPPIQSVEEMVHNMTGLRISPPGVGGWPL